MHHSTAELTTLLLRRTAGADKAPLGNGDIAFCSLLDGCRVVAEGQYYPNGLIQAQRWETLRPEFLRRRNPRLPSPCKWIHQQGYQNPRPLCS